MTDAEATQVFALLTETLREAKLAWIAEQADASISQGILSSKSIRELGVHADDVPYLVASEKSRPAKTLVIAVEYSPKQKLNLLVEAIERGTVEVYDMTLSSLDHLEKEINGLKAFDFRSETAETENFSISHSELISKSAAIVRLKTLLKQLRKEI